MCYKDGKGCGHNSMLNEPNLVRLVVNSAIEGEIGQIGEAF
jgi:hypothetical protein